MSDVWDKIKLEYEITDKSFRMLSQEFGINENTIRKRRWEEGWQRAPNHIKYPRKSNGNSYPKNQFKEGNQAARTAGGLFARYLPHETLDIVNELEDYEAVDFLWQSIKLQYAIIIRSHQIMLVTDKDDHNKFVTGKRMADAAENGGEQLSLFDFGFEVQSAQDRYSDFMKSHSRAMGELRSLIREFYTLADERDERRAKIDLMLQQIEKQKSASEDTPLRVEVIRKDE